MLIYDLTLDELSSFLEEHNFKKYRANQICHWLYKQKAKTFDEMENLPNDVIKVLKENFKIEALEMVIQHKSVDGTLKCLFSLHDGHLIESVLMKQHYGNSICVTTQVGCNIGCSFCASGVLAKKRDLTSGEIIAQVIQTELLLKEPTIIESSTIKPFKKEDLIVNWNQSEEEIYNFVRGISPVACGFSILNDKTVL